MYLQKIHVYIHSVYTVYIHTVFIDIYKYNRLIKYIKLLFNISSNQ